MKLNLRASSALAAVSLIAAAAPLLAAPQHKKPARPAKSGKSSSAPALAASPGVKQENQFVTVDEFVKAGRPARTPVSVEGYAVVVCRNADGSLRMSLVDAVDHVLSPADADSFSKGGASAVVPASAAAKHSGWAWTGKGMQRLAMYTGAGHAQRALHDTVAKVRVSGYATGRTISPVTKVEYQDDNGEWRTL